MKQYTMSLDGEWKLCLRKGEQLSGEVTRWEELGAEAVAGQVPGDWVLDYVRQGLLEEPYEQGQYVTLRQYESSHVFYGRRFCCDREPNERFSLLFEGIDTVADVYLNGVKLGHAENMFIPHEFPASSLRRGENELLVHIYPCVLEARKYPISAFAYSHKYNYESLVIRKAAHMFGWDICPRIVSAGLWRPVTLVEEKPVHIQDVYLWIDRMLENGSVKCTFAFDVELGLDEVLPYSLRVEGRCGGSAFQEETALWYTHGRVSFTLENPRLWWPRGYGAPDQYQMKATLFREGREVDTLEWKQGLRTVQLLHDDCLDENGNGDFCFVVNGRRTFVLGTNWVPADAFHSQDAKRIPQILDLVWDIGCNGLRVWGGGVYESDDFYARCDAMGILVWQDFMMACGIYPNTPRMQEQLRQEATVTVRRLRKHASICLWAGDNECDQNYCWFDMKQDPTGNQLTRGILPEVLRYEDLTRPYLPSSPYVSHEAYVSGRQEDTPEQHLWGPRDYFKSHFYHDATAVFASEMGYHGCNSPQSLRRFIGSDHLWPVDGNPMYLYHCASPEKKGPYTYRIPLMSSQMETLFGQKPENLDEYARMSQISQAEAKKYFVECFRSRKGQRTGIIWWNIMDCWPQISDAVVDYYFCKKLAYFFIRRSQQPVCLMADDHEGGLKLYGVNDSGTPCTVDYQVKDLDTAQTVAQGVQTLATEASTELCTLPADGKPHFLAIFWTMPDGSRQSNHYLQGTPPYDFSWYRRHLTEMGYDEFQGFETEN